MNTSSFFFLSPHYYYMSITQSEAVILRRLRERRQHSQDWARVRLEILTQENLSPSSRTLPASTCCLKPGWATKGHRETQGGQDPVLNLWDSSIIRCITYRIHLACSIGCWILIGGERKPVVTIRLTAVFCGSLACSKWINDLKLWALGILKN